MKEVGRVMGNIHERYEKVKEGISSIESSKKAYELNYNSVLATLRDREQQIEDLTDAELNLDKAIVTFKKISDNRNEDAKQKLEDVLNWALSQIPLEQNFDAQINISDSGKSGKELRITVRDKDKNKVRDIQEQSGTALAQIISFLVTVITLKYAKSTKIMLMDEIFSGLQDREVIRMFGQILGALAEKEGFQFIMVEHASELLTVDEVKQINLGIEDIDEGLVILD